MVRWSVPRCALLTVACLAVVQLFIVLRIRSQEKHDEIFVKVFPRGGDEVSLSDVQWDIGNASVIDDPDYFYRNTSRFIFSNFEYSQGMGNQMFQIASLLAISIDNNATLILPDSLLLRRGFSLTHSRVRYCTERVQSEMRRKIEKIEFEECCRFHNLTKSPFNRLQAVDGYFQNVKYFERHVPTVQKIFSFHSEVQRRAIDFIENAKLSVSAALAEVVDKKMDDELVDGLDAASIEDSLILVGIHVRRGIDITMNQRNVHHGHVAAPLDYFQKAMEAVEKDNTNIVYIICTDNLYWAQRYIKSHRKNIRLKYCPGPREVDMAILSICDHLILSTGTFSWWSAFLNIYPQKQVFYYSNWPEPGTALSSMMNKSDYFPTSWTAIS